VTRDDDISNTVSVFILPDKLITFSMEDRDANEFAIVLAGYYRLIVGELSRSMACASKQAQEFATFQFFSDVGRARKINKFRILRALRSRLLPPP
jgi:hypothetical protein